MYNFEEFNNVLINSITEHMDLYELDNKYAWYVDNINIRYAIERDLYFGFINRLEYFYNLYMTKTIDNDLYKFQLDILKLMIGRDFKILNTNNVKKDMNIINNNNIKNNGKMSLFLIVSLKHLKYIEEILYHLNCDFHILCTVNDIKIINYMEGKSYKYTLLLPKNNSNIIPKHMKFLKPAHYVETMYNAIISTKATNIITVEGCHIQDQLICEIANYLNMKSVCIQFSYAPDYANTFRNMSYTKILTWGDYFSNGLKDYNQTAKFVATGHPSIASNKNKKTDGINIAFFIQAIKYFISKNNFYDFINLIIKIAILYPKANIMVREHPSHPLSDDIICKFKKYDNIVFYNFPYYSIDDILSKSNMAIGLSSSALVESIAYNITPLYVNLSNVTMFNRLKSTKTIKMVYTIEEAISSISISLENKDNFENNNKNNLFECYKEEAIRNIIEEIEND